MRKIERLFEGLDASSGLLLGADYETRLIKAGNTHPHPICITLAAMDGHGRMGEPCLIANGDPEWADVIAWIPAWLAGDRERRAVVAHNGHSFDWPVMIVHFPHLVTGIFDAVEAGQIRDTITREKLRNLAVSGNVDFAFAPDGTAFKISYSLSSLTKKYLGIDRDAEKGVDAKGEQTRGDVWRLNYESLDGLRSDQYPPEAVTYALADAGDACRIKRAQDSIAREDFEGKVGPDGQPFDVYLTEPLHIAAMIALSLATYEGFRVDPAEVEKMEAAIERALRPEQTNLLFESELLSRPLPARPYVNGAKHGNTGKECNCAAPTHAPGTPKMVGPEPSHVSKSLLLELVVRTHAENFLCDEEDCPRRGRECDRHGLGQLKRTDPSTTFPEGQISTDSEVIDDLAPFNPILAQYAHRQGLRKIVENELPRLKDALVQGGRIHGTFDELKKTGRVSSRRSKLFPSINVQQVARAIEVAELGPDGKTILDENGKPFVTRIEPRHAYLPSREGWVLISVDYSYIELCSFAQQMRRVIGYSVLGDKIASGFDPHSFLGAQLAVGLDSDFAGLCDELGSRDADSVYDAFQALKHGTDEERKFHKHWRTMAKSVGLGYPGGLGAKTFIIYAKKMYGIHVQSVEQAKSFREVWLATFPEAREYLNRYVRDNLRDEQHSSEEREKFAYFAGGMYRANCTFTECSNGFALQGPSAIGMKHAVWLVQRACWDPEMKSCLYGCRMNAAVHDEAILSIPNDRYLHERAFEASRLWIAGMEAEIEDVPIKAEPAAMERWDKGAEAVYGPDERLRVWRRGENYSVDALGRLRSAS